MTSQNKLKVIFCTDGIYPIAVGGMQKHSKLLIEELSKNDMLELHVIHPHKNEKLFDGISNIHETGLTGEYHSNYIRNCYLYSKAVFNEISKHPDAIIYSQGLSVWYGIESVANRLIINPHGLEPYQTLSTKDYLKTALFRIIFNKLFNKAAKTISLGGKLTDILKKRISDADNRLVVIPNAVTLSETQDAKPKINWSEPFHFLFVGRFAFNKGIEDLLRCAEMLNKEGFLNRIRFSLVGKGPLYETLKAKYVSPNIHFAGFADDSELAELYSSCHMFILPTLFEGMPTVVLEAMAQGMPIAVTDVGATLEQVDSSNGYIINKHDPTSIKDAIIDFISKNDADRTQMSNASLQKVYAKFSWQHVAQLHFDLFKSLSN